MLDIIKIRFTAITVSIATFIINMKTAFFIINVLYNYIHEVCFLLPIL
jgi:hypothetical protein